MKFVDFFRVFKDIFYPLYKDVIKLGRLQCDPHVRGYVYGEMVADYLQETLGTPSDASVGFSGWAMAEWLESPQARFDLTPDLATMLAATRTKGVDTLWLRLPYSPTLIMYPPGTLTIASLHDDIQCTFALKGENFSGDRLCLFLIHHTRRRGGILVQALDLSERTVDDCLSTIRRNLWEDVSTISAERLRNEFPGSLPLTEDGLSTYRNLAFEEVMSQECAMAHLAVNTILYINSGEEKLEESMSEKEELQKRLKRTTSPGKRKKLARMIGKADPYPAYRLGGAIKLTGHQRKEFRSQRHGGSGGHVISSRFSVRGHWRNQSYGPNHTLRKLLWVKPYMKGPQNTTEVIRSYLVDKKAPE